MNPSSSIEQVETTCCIAGGGPAGMMLGFLLARAGVDVLVLEKHRDFFRDFRGDTIHPSTLELMYELDLLEEFLRLPHEKVYEVRAHFADQVVTIADFTHLSVHCPYIALIPQWDFLNFMSGHARDYPGFHLRMEAEVTELVMEGDRVAGVRARTPEGTLEVRSTLVVGADGRSSIVREHAGLEVIDCGAPIDVLWFQLPRSSGDPEFSFGYIGAGQFMVLIDRGDYWQCGNVIRKGSFEERKARGLPAFREEVVRCADFLADRIGELSSWDRIKLLTVKVDRLRAWCREGLLCIGDSAHAMSPVGGVGINLAIQDAVAAANLLAPKLRGHCLTMDDLRKVQRRRERPAVLTQKLQVFVHEHVLTKVFAATKPVDAPWLARLAEALPALHRIPGRMIGLGFRPEHIARQPSPQMAVA